MRKLHLHFFALFLVVLISAGCANSENNETPPKDTTVKDTINTDPSNFSDPH